jgi:hypothetical protein
LNGAIDQLPAIDIWRAANVMIEMFGEDASLKAAMRADALLEQGRERGLQVLSAIITTWRTGGSGGEDGPAFELNAEGWVDSSRENAWQPNLAPHISDACNHEEFK